MHSRPFEIVHFPLRGRIGGHMPARRKTWREKLHEDKGFPRVFKIDAKRQKTWGDGTCVIPAPTEVDALMRRVPRGKLTTIDQLRGALALRHGATIACPITTGIFAWIAAHAAAEADAAKQKRTTPFWRTLKRNGELNPKYPGGIALLKRKLASEGHRIKQKGPRFFVEKFEERLVRFGEAGGRPRYRCAKPNSVPAIATQRDRVVSP
jgi:hypothetical protein